MVKCIYCLSTSNSSLKKAHIVPEAFLENNVTLEKGIECDICNAYFAKLEQSFIHHNRIWVPIMLYGIPGKSGALRKKLGFYKYNKDNQTISINSKDIKRINQYPSHTQVTFDNPPEFDEHKFRRCFSHISLNYIAWKYGHSFALSNKFDSLRKYARSGNRDKNWPYAQTLYSTNQPPRQDLEIRHVVDAPGFIIKLRSFYDDFYIDVTNCGKLEKWHACNNVHEHYYFS